MVKHQGKLVLVWKLILWIRSQMKQDYPLNLSILLSGGKETKKDVLSSGEWIGQSSKLKSSLFNRFEL